MFTLKDENPNWNETLLMIEICLCAPVSNALLESLSSRMNISNLTLEITYLTKLSKCHVAYENIRDHHGRLSQGPCPDVSAFSIARKSNDKPKQKKTLQTKEAQ